MTNATEWFTGQPDELAKFGPVAAAQILLDAKGDGEVVTHECLALLDTGSSINAIDRSLAGDLGLVPVSKETLENPVWGKWEAEVFSIGIYVPQIDYMDVIEAGSVDLPPNSFAHKLIFGRPFLRGFRLTYDGTIGVVTLGKNEDGS